MRRIEIRISDEEFSLCLAAAQARGVTLHEFYRQAARGLAEELTASLHIAVDAARFPDALEHPERFESGLAWLADRPSVLAE